MQTVNGAKPFVDIWLRRWGIMAAWDAGGAMTDLVLPAAIGEAVGPGQVGLADGPLPPATLERLGLVATELRAHELDLDLSGEPTLIGPDYIKGCRLARPVDMLRRIPSKASEVSDPYILGGDPDGPESAFAFQAFEAVPEGWEVLARATLSGRADWRPVIVSNGHLIASGLPLMDLLAEKMTMPACPDGYWSPFRASAPWSVELWLAELIIEHARRGGCSVLRLGYWPDGLEAAFSIRHDLDRAIPDEEFQALLDFYDAQGVKCSIGFLDRLQIPTQMAELARRGHEVVLHSEAANEDGFRRELASLRETGQQAGFEIVGATCHGGIGSAGHLGSELFDWAARSGLKYTEQLGRDPLIPHPALSNDTPLRNGRSSLMIMTAHHSLDSGTAPRAHNLANCASGIPFCLAAGGAANVMNHPDIHLDQLRALIEWLDLSRVWCATHAEIVEWSRLTRYDATLTAGADGLALAFDSPLTHELTAAILHPGAETSVSFPLGSRAGHIPTSQMKVPDMPAKAQLHKRLGRKIERATARFRKSIAGPLDMVDSRVNRFIEAASNKPPRYEQPARAAVIARTAAEAEEAVAALKGVKGVFRYPPQEIRRFSLAGGALGLPADMTQPASFLHTHANGLFDLVFIDPRIKMFDTAFGTSFLAFAFALAGKGGAVLLPDWSAQASRGAIGAERANELLDAKATQVPPQLLRFPASEMLKPAPSVLTWYQSQGAQLIVEELLFRKGEPDLRDLVSDPIVCEFLVDGALVDGESRGARSGDGEEDFRPALDDIVASHAYLLSGVSYKSALIRHILETLLPGRKGLNYADIGGGYGALAAELLLTSKPSRFACGITRDIASQNILLARSLYTGLHDQLAGRFKFSLGPAESFPFEDGYDVISFVGSLLYVDKNELQQLLERVWAALRPGGLLIVHENIRNPAFSRDYDVMFEAAELDRLLGQFGSIRYFHSNAYAELEAAQAGDKTLFRVVPKAAR